MDRAQENGGWICPDCMGDLQMVDSQSAKCLVHGGVYQILFSRIPPPIVPAEAKSHELAPDALCSKHPKVTATVACNRCGIPICETCTFQRASGRQVCLDCVPIEELVEQASPPTAPPPPPAPVVPAGAKCVQHPAVNAVRRCDLCRSFMCPTCEFQLPGNMHLCPTCATKPQGELSPRRRRLMWGSYGLALLATISLALMMCGVFASMAKSPGGTIGLGYLFLLIMLGPALAGMGMGFSAMGRKSNPISLWIPTLWNLLLAAGFLLLCLIGNLRK